MKRLCLNAQFYLLFFLFSAAAIPVLTLFVALLSLFLSRRRTMRRFRRAISWYGWVVIRVLPRPLVRVIYEDSEPRRGAGCVVVCNHRSASDPFLMACLPHEYVQVVNVWPFRLPALGFFARRAGYLSVRELPLEEFYARCRRFLADGVGVIAFPEGTRAAGREVGPFHSAVFRLALQTGAPIVPVCISGNERIPPRGTGWMEPGTIRIRKLPAIEAAECRGLNAFQLKTRVRDTIIRELGVMEGAA